MNCAALLALLCQMLGVGFGTTTEVDALERAG